MKLKLWIVVAVLLAGCGSDHHEAHGHSDALGHYSFSATLNPTEGNEGLNGFVMFENASEGVFVLAHVEGLDPRGIHGFHIHEFGDCSDPQAMSAGGHFNPHGAQHGSPSAIERHAGDLGNLRADAFGVAHLEMFDTVLAMNGPHSILGKSVVVHAQPDDYQTQPTGDAGARILCGVIVDNTDAEAHHHSH